MRPEINTSTGPNCREVKVFSFLQLFRNSLFFLMIDKFCVKASHINE